MAQSSSAVRKPQATKTLSADEYASKGDDCFLGTNGEFMNRDKAKEYWLKAAKIGHAGAQFALVVNKLVVGEEAMKLLRSSAEQMYPRAMNFMSRLYCAKGDYDWFPEQDLAQSLYWARLSAEKGDAEGQYLYGGHFYYGVGVPKNREESIIWMTKSAEQGYLEAMTALATAYQKGAYISQDRHEMYYWWDKAAETGDARSQYEYANVLFDREGAKEISSREAFPWFQKSAEQGYVDAYSDMVMYYMYGWGGLHVDIPTALSWARKGVAEKDLTCCWLLWEISRQHGKIVNIPHNEVMNALDYAAEHGHLNAKAQRAVMDIKPNGPNTEVWAVISDLADSGQSSRAMTIYGTFLLSGCFGLQKDVKKGTELLRRAAMMGDTLAEEMAKANNVKL